MFLKTVFHDTIALAHAKIPIYIDNISAGFVVVIYKCLLYFRPRNSQNNQYNKITVVPLTEAYIQKTDVIYED